jgi:hypothetical protein
MIVVKSAASNAVEIAARFKSPESGRKLAVKG